MCVRVTQIPTLYPRAIETESMKEGKVHKADFLALRLVVGVYVDTGQTGARRNGMEGEGERERENV